MAPKTEIPNPDVDRALKVLENEQKTWPTYKKRSPIGSYLILFLFLAVVGTAVYYALNHKEEVSLLWNRLTHRDRIPTQVEPGQ